MAAGKAFNIPSFSDSIKRDFENGDITLEQAAQEFYQANYTFYVDMDYTKKKLGLA